ncbi:YihY/virulence factor BrkB family protein [Microbacterium sp.]|uniref:YihY/virulence factor BrkB family protein n=1 Tax=Microbacterium sp. TaxID=51671 RepID=UPI002CD9B7E8|nr:YihY/virulence factor BrkB family protein [Microbacterium sp.]HWK78199.1 YihY/virulence factor BrkB family protein [Microbacterium sp.]
MTSEHAAEPESPAKIDGRSWRLAVRRALRAFGADECPDVAASLTFYSVLALVPAVMVSFSIVSLLGRGEETARIVVDVVRALAPDASAAAVRDAIGQIAEARLSGLLLLFALALTLWAVARYVAALGRGMNRIYGVAEGRPVWRLKAGQLLIALVVIICTALMAVILSITDGVAETLGQAFGLGDVALLVWRVLRWPLLAAIAVFVLAFLYYFAPNVEPARFRWMSLGAAAALVVLLLASFGFWLYVSTLADYDRLYGAFAGVIIFALWLWIANMAILVGAEFDAEVERVRQLQAGIPAETQVQVPLRDARRIAKSVRGDRREEARARRIRG